jgi:hypothetical protein
MIMRILMIAINDPAGTAIEFTKAINKYTHHTCRLITKEIRYNFMFEKDIHLPWLDENGWEEVESLLKKSDVFHFHMTADEYTELGPFLPKDYIKGKQIVHHHHGHPDFRGTPQKYREKYKKLGRSNLLVSTPDLLKLLPEANWQPNLVPIDEPLYSPIKNKPENPVLICHSPTRKDLKNTDEFIQIINEIGSFSETPVKMHIIENTPHKECLKSKRQCHLLFDHLQGYFGVSSLEGLSQGLSVVAGLDEWNIRHIKICTKTTRLPWVIANTCNLKEQLISLINDPDRLKEIGLKSREFMEKSWSPQKVSEQLVAQIQ